MTTETPSPIRIRARDLVIACLVFAGLSYLAWRIESGSDLEAWRGALEGVARGATREVWASISDLGYGGVVAAVVLLLVSMRPTVRQLQNLLLAAASSIAATQALKALVGRTRPDLEGADSWPSGHSSITMVVALSLVASRPRNYTIALLLAGAVGAARVLSLRHFPSDVLGGFALACGLAAVVRSVPTLLPASWLTLGLRLLVTGGFALYVTWTCALNPFALRARYPLMAALVLASVMVNAKRLDDVTEPAGQSTP